MSQPKAIVAGLAALAVLAGFYLYGNWAAPVERDGAHFLFIANNVAAGQSPYWAAFETKNPLVELVWAFVIAIGRGTLTITQFARVVEHLWVFATAAGLLLVCRRTIGIGASIAAGATYLCIVSNRSVADNGLYVSLYHSLPELAVFALLLKDRLRGGVGATALLGVAVFAAWLTKQSSLLPVALMFGTAVYGERSRAQLVSALYATVSFAVCVGVFFSGLLMTDTFASYWAGTVSYKASVAPMLLREFPAVAASVLDPRTLSSWRLPQIAIVLALPLALWSRRAARQAASEGNLDAAFAVTLACVWFSASVLQAILSLAPFGHYYLAAVAPGSLLIAMLVSRLSQSRVRVTFLVASLVGCAAATFAYRRQHSDALRESREAPMTFVVEKLESLIPRGATVFNWNGLPHFHVVTETPSAYPHNMWWPYIWDRTSEAERDEQLSAALRALPPDFVVEIFETYPPSQGYRPFRLDSSTLARWTGRTYEVRAEFEPPPGRYAAPVRVFARRD